MLHRESVRGDEQQPKDECYNSWARHFHPATLPCAGIRLPLYVRRILGCYRRDECASLFWMTLRVSLERSFCESSWTRRKSRTALIPG